MHLPVLVGMAIPLVAALFAVASLCVVTAAEAVLVAADPTRGHT